MDDRETPALTRQHVRAAEFYLERGSQSGLRWTMVFGIFLGLFALIGIGATVYYGIPYWPTATYDYGYLLGLLNVAPTYVLYVVIYPVRNQELTEASTIICAVQWIVNLVVTIVQYSGAFVNQLNLNNAQNAFALAICVIILVFNSVVLVCLLFLTLGARRWLPIPAVDKEFFDRRSSLTALRLTLVFGILMGLWSLLSLEIALMLGVPAWPTTMYSYGYALGTLNYFFWLLFLFTAVFRLRDLIKVGFGLVFLEMVINMIVFVLQIMGVLVNLINLTGSFTSALLGLLATFGPLLFSILIFTSLLDLIMGLETHPST